MNEFEYYFNALNEYYNLLLNCTCYKIQTYLIKIIYYCISQLKNCADNDSLGVPFNV